MDSQQFDKFLETLSAAKIHTDSYNQFIIHDLPLVIRNLVAEFKTPIVKDINEAGFTLEFFGVHIPRACALKNGEYQPITPAICRKENSCYMSPVMASVIQSTRNLEGKVVRTETIRNVVVAHVPVMIGSCLCHTTLKKEQKDRESSTDDGGYFIINGVERVLVTQRRKLYDIPQVLEDSKSFCVNMRSISKETSHSVLLEFSIAKEGSSVICKIPFVSKSIPLGILISAYGKPFEEFQSDVGLEIQFSKNFCMKKEDALDYIGSLATKKCTVVSEDQEEESESFDQEEEENEGSEEESDDEEWQEEGESDVDSEETAEQILINTKRKAAIKYAEKLISSDIFPHLGAEDLEIRYTTICSMIRHLLLARFGRTLADNKDNIFFHRFETSGILLSDLYKMFFRNFLNVYKVCGRGCAITDLTNKLETFILKSIKNCMATGRWGVQKGYIRQGVSQQLSRQSMIATQSHLHRLSLPVGKEGKNVQIRLIHPSQFGFICLFETPEGQGCGVVLNFTASVSISAENQAPEVRDIIMKFFSNFFMKKGNICLWIDNTFCFYIDDPEGFVREFKKLRKLGVIPEQISIFIYRDKNLEPYEVRIFADKGRVLRPLIDPEGDVVKIDSCEIQNSFVAVKREEQDWDYCELHPVLLFSICAGCIPFSNHIQSPRIVYASSMLKQAIGFFTDNYPERYDTTCEVLDYAQKSLVSTKMARAFGMHEAPAGVNCVVAIATLGSWNSEDCIILNKAAVDRGLFSSTTFKTFTVEEYNIKSSVQRKFCIPSEKIRNPVNNFSLLDKNGIVKKGSKISKKDVIVGCIQESTKKGDRGKELVQKDCSELSEVEGIVESAEIVSTFSGNRIAKIVVKIRKIPERGDKFANINAQKGTCGIILPPEDMPFCEEDGIIPDLIMNPNALPSRMTMSMFLELIRGQEGAHEGELKDATPFEEIEALGEILAQNGYDRMGTKILVDGTSGKRFRARITMGLDFYQKLKHLVSNKISSRNFGNVTVSTRQPVSGRSKKGGVRAGEMEVQGWLSHGVGDFLREKLFDCSDKFSVFICEKCGIISNHKDLCSSCQGEVVESDLSYASKIVFQILNMCSIKTEFGVKII